MGLVQLLNIKFPMDKFKVEFPLICTHCRVFMCNVIHASCRILVYGALTTPEPLRFSLPCALQD